MVVALNKQLATASESPEATLEVKNPCNLSYKAMDIFEECTFFDAAYIGGCGKTNVKQTLQILQNKLGYHWFIRVNQVFNLISELYSFDFL
jgi:hypothetical protein